MASMTKLGTLSQCNSERHYFTLRTETGAYISESIAIIAPGLPRIQRQPDFLAFIGFVPCFPFQ